MKLHELHERIGWQLAGELQVKTNTGKWVDWNYDDVPSLCLPASDYRRRPTPPPMPDEVWVSPKTPECHMAVYEERFAEGLVRYVRAGAEVPGSKVEWKHNLEGWIVCTGVTYRIKP